MRFMLRSQDPWCSWLTRLPVTQEIAGSSPVGSAVVNKKAVKGLLFAYLKVFSGSSGRIISKK